MATSKNLKTAVKAAVKDAKSNVDTGNEQTIAESPTTIQRASTGASIQDPPTGTRRDRPSA